MPEICLNRVERNGPTLTFLFTAGTTDLELDLDGEEGGVLLCRGWRGSDRIVFRVKGTDPPADVRLLGQHDETFARLIPLALPHFAPWLD